MPAPHEELFELELVGGAYERRYRSMRPEVAAMPWGTLDVARIAQPQLIAARRLWTNAAFQEHRTAIACATTLRALLEARAPIDLVALASRFPLDEIVHVELCARMAMELGGGTELRHDPSALVMDADPSQRAIVRAAELIVRNFCIGEALSIPLLRGTWHAAKHPLPRAVLGRIVRDEAAHGTFGFTVLDWALPQLDRDEIAHLGRRADLTLRAIHAQWDDLRRRAHANHEDAGDALSWMESEAYLALAKRSLRTHVLAPLEERDISLSWNEEGPRA